MTFTEENYKDIEHLLPDSVKSLITVAGVEATFELIRYYGGTTFPVGKNKTRLGNMLHAALSEVVGNTVADRISEAYGNQRKIFIPKCDGPVRELRDRAIRRQFDQLTQAKNITAWTAANQLARTFKLTDRHIWRILGNSDMAPELEKKQKALF